MISLFGPKGRFSFSDKQKAPQYFRTAEPLLALDFQPVPYWDHLVYWLGAPGVGTLLTTCVPLACDLVNALVRVIPLPETCAPFACDLVSGVATVMEMSPGAP